MLTCAAGWPVSNNMEVGFTFNELETKSFWANTGLDHSILLDEWEHIGERIGGTTSRYEKTLFGRKFYIQFTYSKEKADVS